MKHVQNYNIPAKMVDYNVHYTSACFSHSTMFLDSSITVPTAAGFPLKLSVNGSATVNMKLAGKMDFRTSDIVVKANIQPRWVM